MVLKRPRLLVTSGSCNTCFLPIKSVFFAGKPAYSYCGARPRESQLTLPSLTVREGLNLPPAPSLSRDGSNRDYSSLIHSCVPLVASVQRPSEGKLGPSEVRLGVFIGWRGVNKECAVAQKSNKIETNRTDNKDFARFEQICEISPTQSDYNNSKEANIAPAERKTWRTPKGRKLESHTKP